MYGLRVIVADQSAYLPTKGCCVRLNEVPRSSNLKLGLYKRPAILAPAGFFMSFNQRTLIYFYRAIIIALVISCESPDFPDFD